MACRWPPRFSLPCRVVAPGIGGLPTNCQAGARPPFRETARLGPPSPSGDVDRLHVDELADSERAELAAVTRRANAAEGQPRVRLDEGVDEAAPGLELVGG